MPVTLGIRGKLIAYTMAIVILVGGGLSWFFNDKLSMGLVGQFNATTELVTESTLSAVRDPLYFMNVTQVRETLARALANEMLAEVTVLDAKGRILSDGSLDNLNWLQFTQDPEAQGMVASRQPIQKTLDGRVHAGRLVWSQGGDLLGFLYFEFSTQNLEKAKRKTFWLSLGMTSAFLALGGLMALVLAHRATRPLTQMLAVVRKIAAGDDSEAPLPVERSDEIGALQAGINAMAKAVHDARVGLEDKVRERTEQLEEVSKTDLLTQLLNRRGMSERIEFEILRAHRENRQLGLLWIDADHFKNINDTHGHAIGDRALVVIGKAIKFVLRPYDYAARWGGDEFIAIFQDCDELKLGAIGERLLKAVAHNQELKGQDGRPVSLRVTIGGTLLAPADSLEQLLHKADHALYVAKENGRNQYQFHHE